MKNRVSKSLNFTKTTAVGGLLFLLPLAVVAVLLAYTYQIVVTVHKALQPWNPFHSWIGFAVLYGLAILLLLTACFGAGLLARRAIGARFSEKIEKQLMKVFPKYGIFKDLLADKIGGNENVPSLRPVLVKREGVYSFAFQADRLANGLIVVYFPGSPDAWAGSIAMIAQEHVLQVDLPFDELLGICERLGRDSSSILNSVDLPIPDSNKPSSEGTAI